MRIISIAIVLMVLVAAITYSASITGTAKALGGGSASVPHCQVQQYDIAASDTISSVNVGWSVTLPIPTQWT